MTEEWKEIPGYEGLYEVSDQGRIRSVRKTTNTYPGRILKPAQNRNGYLQVCLSRNNKSHWRYIHRLVMAAFERDAPELQVNHKNGDRRDNRLANLEYVTPSENIRHSFEVLDRVRKGSPPRPRGEENPRAILTWEKVRHIRRLYKTGEHSQRKLAQAFGVSRSAIENIVSHKTWRTPPTTDDAPSS